MKLTCCDWSWESNASATADICAVKLTLHRRDAVLSVEISWLSAVIRF